MFRTPIIIDLPHGARIDGDTCKIERTGKESTIHIEGDNCRIKRTEEKVTIHVPLTSLLLALSTLTLNKAIAVESEEN